MSEKPWTVIHSQMVLDVPYFRLRRDVCQLSDGQIIQDYYVMESNDVVLVCALTDDEQVLMVEQYRHAAGRVCLQFPGGMCDGDDPAADARRELMEETGYTARTFTALGSFIHDPTRYGNHFHLFLAEGAQRVADQSLDVSESITVRKVPLDDLMRMMQDGTIQAVDTCLAIHTVLWHLHGR